MAKLLASLGEIEPAETEFTDTTDGTFETVLGELAELQEPLPDYS